MQLPILILMLSGALLPPLVSYELYNRLYLWEKRQIVLDNTVIRVARTQARAMNILSRAQRALEQLEHAHHVVHFVPPAIKVDKILETAIRLTHKLASVSANSLWLFGSTKERLTVLARRGYLRTQQTLPVSSVHCRICHMASGWELKPRSPEITTARILSLRSDNRARTKLVGDRITSDWSYQMLDEGFE